MNPRPPTCLGIYITIQAPPSSVLAPPLLEPPCYFTQTGLVLGSIFLFFLFLASGDFPYFLANSVIHLKEQLSFYLEFPLVCVGAESSGVPTLGCCRKWWPWLSGHRFFWGLFALPGISVCSFTCDPRLSGLLMPASPQLRVL